MKYKALVTANPKIRPIRRRKNGRHYFILYCDPRCFRDLKNGNSSPISPGPARGYAGDGKQPPVPGRRPALGRRHHQGNARDVLELGTPFTNVGDGATTEVGCAFLCGAQAVGAAYAKRWKSTTEDFDYGDKHGVAISSIYGIGKMQFGTRRSSDTGDLKDHGVVTGYFATTN